MTRCGHYRDSVACDNPKQHDEGLAAQYLSVGSTYGADSGTDAKTLYQMLSALDRVRPCIVFWLARVARNQDHFADLLNSAMAAAAHPENAEYIAADAVDGFPASSPEQADAVWNIILLAAGQEMVPDEDWDNDAAMVLRIRRAVG